MLLFLLVSLVSVFILLINLGAIYHSSWYLPLQLKSAKLDRLLAFFSLIHLWSVLIAYDTEEVFHPLREISCSLWSYWIQLFCGLQPFVLVMIFRVLQHKQPSIPKPNLFRFGITCLSAIPLGIFCFLVPVEIVDNVCTTPLWWKLPFFLWSFLALVMIAILGLWVYRKAPHVTRNLKTLRDCICVSLVVFFAVASLHFFGIVPEWTVFFISFLHFFIAMRMFSYSLVKAMLHDETYVESFFLLPSEAQTIEHRSTTTLVKDPDAMQHFIDWVYQEGQRDTVDFYERLREILIKQRECQDITQDWESLQKAFPLEFVPGEEQSVEVLYQALLERLQIEFGKEYFSKGIETPLYCNDSILDSSSASSVELEAYLETTEEDSDVVYAELKDFKE